jgi:DNA modification methylase
MPSQRYSKNPYPWETYIDVQHDDCLTALRAIPPDSISSIVTDPPYGLSAVSSADTIQAITAWASGDRERVPDGKGFMNHEWDRFVPPPAVWDECFRVLKPGGHMAVFAGTRTADLMGLSIRLAGFDFRDTITWLYGSGMPKGLNIGKAIDKAAGAEREVIGAGKWAGRESVADLGFMNDDTWQGGANRILTAPATDAAKQWEGWNTALKPAGEPILVVQKPFTGTIVNNVLKHGTGAMNIDACRIPVTDRQNYEAKCASVVGLNSNRNGATYGTWTDIRTDSASSVGRWPANVVLSHADGCAEGVCCKDGCSISELDDQSGIHRSPGTYTRSTTVENHIFGASNDRPTQYGHGDIGGASRFYNVFRYQAKAPKSERPTMDGISHPTVKPLALIKWLVALFTPPGGIVLDPFGGSGTTGQAAHMLGFNSIVIEREAQYMPLIDKRLSDYFRGVQ